MVDQERWAEIRRLFDEERVSISIGRRLDLDRKTVRRSVCDSRPGAHTSGRWSRRPPTAHADFVQTRAPQVGQFSARILYQELRASRAIPAVTRP